MKKIVLMLAMMIATMTVSASNILYFTYNQAVRTVTCLNNQNELMIYCGYPDELPTYVIINEVWAEQIGSSFYEIWLYGFDAYTGEEIYMPIDLDCIYLMQNHSIYSAAQFLRFRHTRPQPKFVWAMPPYNPFVRLPRPKVYYYTYHYDIHRPGWHWTHYPHITYHPYYRRLPSQPAPIPHKPYTPGRERPGYNETPSGYQYNDLPLVGNITACRSQVPVQNDPSTRGGNRITSERGSTNVVVTDRSTGKRSSVDNSGRGNSSTSRTGTASESRGNSSTSRTGTASESRGNSSTSRTGTASESRGNSNTNRTGTASESRGNSNTNRTGTASESRGNSNTNRTGTASESRSNSNSRSDVSTDSRSNNGTNRTSNASESRSNSNSRTGVSTDSRSTSSTASESRSRSNSRTGSSTDSRKSTATDSRSNSSTSRSSNVTGNNNSRSSSASATSRSNSASNRSTDNSTNRRGSSSR